VRELAERAVRVAGDEDGPSAAISGDGQGTADVGGRAGRGDADDEIVGLDVTGVLCAQWLGIFEVEARVDQRRDPTGKVCGEQSWWGVERRGGLHGVESREPTGSARAEVVDATAAAGPFQRGLHDVG